jgi:predicted transcriptional regulator
MGEVVYIPLSQDTISKIERLKNKDEEVKEFIEKLVEEKIMAKEVYTLQIEKMKELWNNEEDEIWNNLK